MFRPSLDDDVHWTNDAGPLTFAVGGKAEVDRRVVVADLPKGLDASQETRQVDFEIMIPKGAGSEVTVDCYAVYYICEGAEGECLYLRQDVPVVIEIE